MDKYPDVFFEVPDIVSDQLERIHGAMKRYKQKPIEGLDGEYIKAQRMLSGAAIVLSAIVESIDDVVKSQAKLTRDLFFRIQKSLNLLNQDKPTKDFVGNWGFLQLALDRSRQATKAMTTSFESYTQKSPLWGLSSCLRLLLANAIFEIEVNSVANFDDANPKGQPLVDICEEDLFDVTLSKTIVRDFECAKFHYGSYQFKDQDIYNRPMFLEDIIDGNNKGTIPSYFASDGQAPQGLPILFQNYLQYCSWTQDKLCVFENDIHFGGETTDFSPEIISSIDTYPQDTPMNVNKNFKADYLRDEIIERRSSIIPMASFKSKNKEKNYTPYEEEVFYFSVPRIIRSNCLYQINNFRGTQFVAAVTNKAINGDLLDGVVGIHCLRQKFPNMILSFGNKQTLISAIKKTNSLNDVFFVVHCQCNLADIQPQKKCFLSHGSEEFEPTVSNIVIDVLSYCRLDILTGERLANQQPLIDHCILYFQLNGLEDLNGLGNLSDAFLDFFIPGLSSCLFQGNMLFEQLTLGHYSILMSKFLEIKQKHILNTPLVFCPSSEPKAEDFTPQIPQIITDTRSKGIIAKNFEINLVSLANFNLKLTYENSKA